MAWHNVQQTMRLLTALQEMGKGQSGAKDKKGGGKGDKGAAHQKKRLCPWADCKAAQQKQQTIGGTTCHCCRRPFASTPPLEKLVEWAYAEKLNTSPTQSKADKDAAVQGKGKGKSTGKSGGKQSAATAADTAKALSPEQLKDLRATRLAGLKTTQGGNTADAGAVASYDSPQQRLPQEPGKLDASALEELENVQPTIKEILQLVATDLAVTMPQAQDANAALASHMAAFSPCTTVEAKAELEARLAETKGFLAATNAPKVRARLQEQLDEDEKELSQLCRRGSPSSAQEASCLREALQALDRLQKARFDKEQLGKTKAKERTEKRFQLLEILSGQVDILKQSVETHDAEHLAKHEAKSQVLSEQEETVAALLRTRIDAADAEVARLAQLRQQQQQQQVGAAQAGQASANAQPDPLAVAMAQLEEMKNTQLELLTKIQDMQQREGTLGDKAADDAMEVAKQALIEASAVQAKSDATMTFLDADDVYEEATPDDLPDFVPPSQESLDACSHLYFMLKLWNEGGCLAFNLGELKGHCKAKEETLTLLRSLLGTKLWDGWFDVVADPFPDEEILPRQAVLYLALALEKLKTRYDAIEATTIAAKESYAIMAATTKKRRALKRTADAV